MDLRDSKNRLILIVIALGAALVIAVASCAGNDDEGSDQGQEQTSEDSQDGDGEGGGGDEGSDGGSSEEAAEPLAEVTGGEELTLTITSVEREEGGFITVEGTLHNGGDNTFFDLNWAGGETELAENGFSMAGASLVATEEEKRYLILRDTSGRCLCTGFGTGIEPDAAVSWFAQFPEPQPETTQVDFQVGDLPPATIEIR
ncbi:hypothetical protein [Streptomyces sp. B6B3]|uniref:hypothetical protein n=1 Tax=Streptomyces sp. B6B3 TaxID=3153570 RepID=UPI00325E259A